MLQSLYCTLNLSVCMISALKCLKMTPTMLCILLHCHTLVLTLSQIFSAMFRLSCYSREWCVSFGRLTMETQETPDDTSPGRGGKSANATQRTLNKALKHHLLCERSCLSLHRDLLFNIEDNISHDPTFIHDVIRCLLLSLF